MTIQSQNINKKESLISIIENLQKQHHVKFNYAEDAIVSVFLEPPSKSYTLKQSLAYLEKNTTLKFRFDNTNFIIITKKKEFMLCGYLYDKDNLQPLVSATIQSQKNSTTTNKEGYFQIKVNQPSELITIRYLGYKTVSRPYNQFLASDCDQIYLRLDYQSLSEVLISNYITTGINKINDGSFKIDFKNFDILPGLIENDVLQAVQSFPGIQSSNETVSNINIRGGTHDQNLILWDNIKMYQSGHFFGLISMFNPQITQQVFVLKNGSNVTYTDGVSGTISMHTDQNINAKFNANVGVNLTDVNTFLDMPTGKKGSVQIAGRKSINELFSTPTYTNYFDRISQNTEIENTTNTDKLFDFYDTSLRWIYNISDKDQIKINFINVSNQLEFDENAIIDGAQESRTSRLTQNSLAGGLYFKHVFNPKINTTLEAYETRYKLKAVNANILEFQRFLQENKVSETSLKLKTNYILNKNIELLGGYHFVETEVTNLDDVDTPVFRVLISEVLRTHGAFGQVNYQSPNKNTNLNVGFRYNYLDKFKKQIWEPRLHFSQRFLEDFTFEVLGEFKHQSTSHIINFQNDFLGIEKRRWQLSDNQDIPVIESRQLSTGFHFNTNGWLVSFEGYYKTVNGITTQSQGFQNQFEFVKSKGSYDVKGLDILFRKLINPINIWISYAYMNNQYTFNELESESFPSNYDINHTITFGASYTNNNFKVAAGFNWHSGKPITIPRLDLPITNQSINFDTTNNANLEDYVRLDISAQYDFKLSSTIKGKAGISVWNLLNKENQVNTFFRVRNEAINQTQQRSLGITPNATFRIYF